MSIGRWCLSVFSGLGILLCIGHVLHETIRSTRVAFKTEDDPVFSSWDNMLPDEAVKAPILRVDEVKEEPNIDQAMDNPPTENVRDEIIIHIPDASNSLEVVTNERSASYSVPVDISTVVVIDEKSGGHSPSLGDNSRALVVVVADESSLLPRIWQLVFLWMSVVRTLHSSFGSSAAEAFHNAVEESIVKDQETHKTSDDVMSPLSYMGLVIVCLLLTTSCGVIWLLMNGFSAPTGHIWERCVEQQQYVRGVSRSTQSNPPGSEQRRPRPDRTDISDEAQEHDHSEPRVEQDSINADSGAEEEQEEVQEQDPASFSEFTDLDALLVFAVVVLIVWSDVAIVELLLEMGSIFYSSAVTILTAVVKSSISCNAGTFFVVLASVAMQAVSLYETRQLRMADASRLRDAHNEREACLWRRMAELEAMVSDLQRRQHVASSAPPSPIDSTRSNSSANGGDCPSNGARSVFPTEGVSIMSSLTVGTPYSQRDDIGTSTPQSLDRFPFPPESPGSLRISGPSESSSTSGDGVGLGNSPSSLSPRRWVFTAEDDAEWGITTPNGFIVPPQPSREDRLNVPSSRSRPMVFAAKDDDADWGMNAPASVFPIDSWMPSCPGTSDDGLEALNGSIPPPAQRDLGDAGSLCISIPSSPETGDVIARMGPRSAFPVRQ